MMIKGFVLAVIASGLMAAGQAWAWGDTGHRTIGSEAMHALPAILPGFLRTATAAADVGEYSREPDLWRGSGTIHDAERDPAHFVALDDDGKTFAGLTLDALPATRSDYEAAIRARGLEPAKAGYLPYSTIDAYQQVAKDLAYWRTIRLAIDRQTNAGKKTWLKAMLRRREDLVLRDIGILSHYVGDATQPMHVSIHGNGWGAFPNPEGFTQDAIHWPLEGAYIRAHVTSAMVRSKMAAYEACATTQDICVSRRLQRNFAQVLPLYRLEKAGGFKDGDARGPDYLAGLMARGASDLRDMIEDAWRASPSIGVGHGQQPYSVLVANPKADLYALLVGET